MTPTQILFIAVLVAGLAVFASILARPRQTGNPILAALLCAGFATYTAVQLAREGAVMFWTNHSANLTGVQVWADLIIMTLIALFLIAPRARAAGMNVPLWAAFVAATASIGMLAMCTRLFWLEAAAAREAGNPA
jgi:nicotinamide riboside transporter PnuC